MEYASAAVATSDGMSPGRSVGSGEDASPPPEDLPACMSCRKRKSRCSRELPSCSQCTKIGCECRYAMRQKPGMKPGAVDGLNRRIEVLERILLRDPGNRDSLHASLETEPRAPQEHALSITNGSEGSLRHNCLPRPHIAGGSSARSSSVENSLRVDWSGRKRRRIGESSYIEDVEEPVLSASLPSLPVLEAVVEAHFETVHHWIPILHETRFRAKLGDAHERGRIAVVLHALLSTAIKYVNFQDFGMRLEDANRLIQRSRQFVMMQAMESLSVENTQALIFLAFDFMGGGHLTKAWSIIGSLTRTVDYLQLTVEPEDESHKQPLLRSLHLLRKPEDWTESEERRRLFWSVFLLDRVCSFTSGWHTSLTSDDVRRRLPCSGGLWARSEPATTPLFGIWDKSIAKIGNSISSVPAINPSPSTMKHPSLGSAGDVDTSKLGAFAYCIEATENLSQVTSFFLLQSVDFGDREEVKNWLTRFKELDLRLVLWKKYLPQQWQDSDIARDAHIIKMDPNLTLAHLSHNTSMILLHQHIAYPPSSWMYVVKLPSSCSAETCQFAAVETASIVRKYLRYMGGIINSQFMFSAFVAARVFLVHWRFNENNDLAPEFFDLLQSLQAMSNLWRGFCKIERRPNEGETSIGESHDELDLAAKYAAQLRHWHSRCINDPSFNPSSLVDILSEASLDGVVKKPAHPTQTTGQGDSVERAFIPRRYSTVHDTRRPNNPGPTNMERDWNGRYVPIDDVPVLRPISRPRLTTGYERQGARVSPEDLQPQARFNYAQSPMVAAANASAVATNNSSAITGGMNMEAGQHDARTNCPEDDELTAMSHMLLGNQFLEMDRVITLDGTSFFSYDVAGPPGLS